MSDVHQHLSLRPACAADAEPVWNWRAAMSSAFLESAATVDLADHIVWFDRALRCDDRHLLILERHPGIALGHLRLDLGPKNSAVVSIVLNTESRGQGLSMPALLVLEDYARQRGITKLTATIHHDNAASARGFSRAGYVEIAQQGTFSRWERDLQDPT